MSRRLSNSSYDPRKAQWNNISIEDWDPSKWKQWKPKATGTDYPVNMEREYLRMRYAVQQVNDQLDIAGVRVKLKLTNHKSIGLQGTFPCKNNDVGKNGSPNKQYVISLGVAANDAGVKTADLKARQLDFLLTTKQFYWTPELLGKKAQRVVISGEQKAAKLIGELIEEYEVEYWKTHEKNRQGIANWKTGYIQHLKKLPQNVPLSNDAISQAIDKTKPGTYARCRLIWQIKRLCELCDFDCSKVVKSYATSKPKCKTRIVPSDDEILNGFTKIGESIVHGRHTAAIQPEQWQWIYGMLATYGLRPHELFAVDLEDYNNSKNVYHFVKLDPQLTKGTKTGERSCGIPPLHPEWVELFNLRITKLPSSKADFYSLSKIIGNKFRRTGMDFMPYSLRHAYAIRGHRLGIQIKTMADFMGHTVKEHTETYQRWMSRDTNTEIYKETVLGKQAKTKEDLKSENELLKAKLELLKAENESMKQLLTQRQLDELFNR